MCIYTILVWISTNMNYFLQFGGYYMNGRYIILQKKGYQESTFALNHKIKPYYTVSTPPLSFFTLKTLEIIHLKASSQTHHTYQISFGISERRTTSALPPGVVNSHLSFQFSFIFFFF